MNLSFPQNVKKILFVCTGNSCRSVMAERFFRKRAKEEDLAVVSESAGIAAHGAMPASPETIEVLEQKGIRAGDHLSQPVTSDLIEESDLIVVMTESHRRSLLDHYPDIESKTRLLTDCYDGEDRLFVEAGLPDPIGQGLGFYERVFAVIRESVNEMVSKLRDME